MHFESDDEQIVSENNAAEASERVKVDGTKPPDIPLPSSDLRAWTKKWWDITDNVPAFDRAVEAARFCRQTLMPSWWDPKDPWGGRVPSQSRRRKDEREVRVPIAYLQVQQTVAMLVPADHRAKWNERPQVGSKTESGKYSNEVMSRFAETVELVVKSYCEEAGIQSKLEAWKRDALVFPMGVLKVYFSRGWSKDPMGCISSEDSSDSVERIRVLAEDALRGEIHSGDPEWIELESLMKGLSSEASLALVRKLVIEVIPPTAFRFSDSVKSFDQIASAQWMAHDVELSRAEIRERFPFSDCGDGCWEGIHPDDAERICGSESDALRASDETPRGRKGRKTNNSSDKDALVLVRELWDRQTGEVSILVKGVDYPVRRWFPKRTPRGFFPFHPLVFNEFPHSPYGVSDVEMLSDIQARSNRKRSDEEKARWNSLPRGAYDTSTGDDKEAIKLQDIQPGQAIGINLGGKKISEVVQWWQWPYNPESFSTVKDEQDARMVGNLPEQSLGVTGRAKFAAEVQTAAIGASIASDARRRRSTRALACVYDSIAQILLQELTADEVREIAGPGAIWPKVWDASVAKETGEQIKASVRQSVTPRVMQSLQSSPAFQMLSGEAREMQMIAQIESVAAPLVNEQMHQVFGHHEPLTREALYRRLSCELVIDDDPRANRESRLGGTAAMVQSIAQIVEAAKASGMTTDVEKLMSRFMRMAGYGDTTLEGIFSNDPSAEVAKTIVTIQDSPQKIDPKVMQALVQVVAQMMQPQQPQQAERG